jgi:integrase
VLLGDSQLPCLRSLLAAFPLEEERARTTSLTAGEFWALVDAATEHARPCYVVLAITGLRVGEYLRCTPADLRADECSIDVPGTKTRASAATIFPASEFWPWIGAGIPSPLGSRWLRNYFKAAATAIGRPELRVHDLRRLFAQLASDAGAPAAQVQAALRHANLAMTRRYEMTVRSAKWGSSLAKHLVARGPDDRHAHETESHSLSHCDAGENSRRALTHCCVT